MAAARSGQTRQPDSQDVKRRIGQCDDVGAQLLGSGPQAVRHLWEAARLGLGEPDTAKLEFFPARSLRQAIEAFTEAACGRRLTFAHA